LSIRRLVTLALSISGFLAASSSPLAAMIPAAHAGDDRKASAELGGTYAIEGTFANGNAFTGTLEMKKWKTVELRKGPSFTMYDLAFKYSTDWEGVGVGVLLDGRFYFSLAHQGKFFTVLVFRPVVLTDEMAAFKAEFIAKERERSVRWKQGKDKDRSFYFVKGDPWWTDIWRDSHYALFFQHNGRWGTEGIGAEGLEDQTPALGAGHWSWLDHYYDDKGKDTSAIMENDGQLVSEALENGAYKITRRVYTGSRKGEPVYSEPWAGVGLMPDANTLVVDLGGDGTDGVGYYDIVGKTFEGKLCDVTDPAPYTQKLTVPDGVIERNPDLFH
jgi:hypothetical protein